MSVTSWHAQDTSHCSSDIDELFLCGSLPFDHYTMQMPVRAIQFVRRHRALSILCCLYSAFAGAPGVLFYMQSDIVAPYISKYGTDEQRKRFLPSMTAGKCITAIGMSEPGAGRSE